MIETERPAKGRLDKVFRCFQRAGYFHSFRKAGCDSSRKSTARAMVIGICYFGMTRFYKILPVKHNFQSFFTGEPVTGFYDNISAAFIMNDRSCLPMFFRVVFTDFSKPGSVSLFYNAAL